MHQVYFNSELDPSAVPKEVFSKLMMALSDRQAVTPKPPGFVTFAQLPDNITSLPNFPAPRDFQTQRYKDVENEPSAGRKLIVPRTNPSPYESSPAVMEDNSCHEDRNGHSAPLTFARFRAIKQRLYPKRPFNKSIIKEALSPLDRSPTTPPQLPLVI